MIPMTLFLLALSPGLGQPLFGKPVKNWATYSARLLLGISYLGAGLLKLFAGGGWSTLNPEVDHLFQKFFLKFGRPWLAIPIAQTIPGTLRMASDGILFLELGWWISVVLIELPNPRSIMYRSLVMVSTVSMVGLHLGILFFQNINYLHYWAIPSFGALFVAPMIAHWLQQHKPGACTTMQEEESQQCADQGFIFKCIRRSVLFALVFMTLSKNFPHSADLSFGGQVENSAHWPVPICSYPMYNEGKWSTTALVLWIGDSIPESVPLAEWQNQPVWHPQSYLAWAAFHSVEDHPELYVKNLKDAKFIQHLGLTEGEVIQTVRAKLKKDLKTVQLRAINLSEHPPVSHHPCGINAGW